MGSFFLAQPTITFVRPTRIPPCVAQLVLAPTSRAHRSSSRARARFCVSLDRGPDLSGSSPPLPHSVRLHDVQDGSAWPARVAGPSLPCGPSVFEHCWVDPVLALFPPYLLSASCAGGWWTDSEDLGRNKMPISPLGLRALVAGSRSGQALLGPIRYVPGWTNQNPPFSELSIGERNWGGGAPREEIGGNLVGASIIACTAEQRGWRTDHHGQSWSNPSRPRSNCAAVEVLWSSMATSSGMVCRRRNRSDVAVRGHDLVRDAPLCRMEDVHAPPDRIDGGVKQGLTNGGRLPWPHQSACTPCNVFSGGECFLQRGYCLCFAMGRSGTQNRWWLVVAGGTAAVNLGAAAVGQGIAQLGLR
jgi:hypothetical protein